MSTQTPSRQSVDQRTDTQSAPTREMANAQQITSRQMPQGVQPGMAGMQPGMAAVPQRAPEDVERHRGTETKPAYMTTEFYIYLAAVGGILLASWLVGRNSVGVDVFRADNAWFFITLLTIAYLGSRGLAKLGSAWRRAQR